MRYPEIISEDPSKQAPGPLAILHVLLAFCFSVLGFVSNCRGKRGFLVKVKIALPIDTVGETEVCF